MKYVFKVLICLTLSLSVNSCKKEDKNPCEGIVCENFGTCVNGTCDCPENYEGPRCKEQKTPSGIKVVETSLQNWSDFDANGNAWDLTSAPDIFVRISSDNTVIFNSSVSTNNSTGTLDFASNYFLYPYSGYTIQIYDKDSPDEDDLMYEFSLDPYYANNGFPSPIVLNLNNFYLFLQVEYQF